MIKAVIFDRDGVIFDSEFANINTGVETLKKMGIEITEEQKKLIVGRHPADYTKYFLPNPEEQYEEFIKLAYDTYFELLKQAPIYEKTVALIKRLHEKGIPLGLTTSSQRKDTVMLLERAGVIDMFKVIVTFEDYEKRKPAPDPYLVTAKKLEIDPKDCIVVEDSDVGVEAAKAAGMKCIAMPNHNTKDEDFSKADFVVGNADEIDKILTTLK